MPLYEYECTACHRRTEKIQKYSDADLTICPRCGGALERTITAAAISFKGGGWYKDGYASAKPAASGSDDSSAPAATSDTGSADKGLSTSASSDSGSAGASAKPVTTPSVSPAPAPATTTKA